MLGVLDGCYGLKAEITQLLRERRVSDRKADLTQPG
jgi:hypothetical protein